MNKFLKSAAGLARTHEYDHHIVFQLCSIIYRGGSILSIGYNGRNKNSFVDHFAAESGIDEERPFINMHSELAAIVQVRAKVDLSGAKMAVARVLRDGTLAMARPCGACEAAMVSYGIKRCSYTIAEGEWGILKI